MRTVKAEAAEAAVVCIIDNVICMKVMVDGAMAKYNNGMNFMHGSGFEKAIRSFNKGNY